MEKEINQKINGLKEGLWIFYASGHRKHLECNYKNDKHYGLFKYYDYENWKIKYKCFFL